jgi:hypothetical protein
MHRENNGAPLPNPFYCFNQYDARGRCEFFPFLPRAQHRLRVNNDTVLDRATNGCLRTPTLPIIPNRRHGGRWTCCALVPWTV